MFSEILKIKPQLDAAAASAMEKNLNTRFQKIAKKFGGGIMSVIKGGGVLGVATALIDKVLNPLQSVQEAIEKALGHGDDLATYAKQFNTTAGALARLQAFGRATGLDPDGLRMLLGKFQASVARASEDPSKESAVSAYVGRADTAEAFFEFIQAVQKMDQTSQNLIQQQVFGEKQILKASEFLNANFAQLNSLIGGPTAQELTVAAEKLANNADARDIFSARRDLQDLRTKGQLITPKTIMGMVQGEDMELANDNKRLARYDDLKKISMATDRLVKLLEDAYLKLSPVLGQYLPGLIEQLTFSANAVEKSRTIKGLIPGAGKDR